MSKCECVCVGPRPSDCCCSSCLEGRKKTLRFGLRPLYPRLWAWNQSLAERVLVLLLQTWANFLAPCLVPCAQAGGIPELIARCDPQNKHQQQGATQDTGVQGRGSDRGRGQHLMYLHPEEARSLDFPVDPPDLSLLAPKSFPAKSNMRVGWTWPDPLLGSARSPQPASCARTRQGQPGSARQLCW